MTQRRRICIVGGGPAGLAAALSLTDPTTHPNWQEEYDVVVLQLGWRAGGKGATGRRGTSHWVSDGAGGGEWQLRGDARVEEHGIHLFGHDLALFIHPKMLRTRCNPRTSASMSLASL